MLTASTLSACAAVGHGFLTRDGGISDLGWPPGCLVTARQVHSATAVYVTTRWRADGAPEADALITDRPGMALGVLTADCAPVLFADGRNRVAAAAHAGWRGARAGVLEACVAAMVERGASVADIDAAVGPCIGAKSYEVGPEFHHDFIGDDPASEVFFRPSERSGRFLFDLAGYVAARLKALGLASIEILDCDTLTDPDRFYSHRRGVLSGVPETGRLLSVIRLEES